MESKSRMEETTNEFDAPSLADASNSNDSSSSFFVTKFEPIEAINCWVSGYMKSGTMCNNKGKFEGFSMVIQSLY